MKRREYLRVAPVVVGMEMGGDGGNLNLSAKSRGVPGDGGEAEGTEYEVLDRRC